MPTEHAIAIAASILALVFLGKPALVWFAETLRNRGRVYSTPGVVRPGAEKEFHVYATHEGVLRLIIQGESARHFQVTSLKVDGSEQLAVEAPALLFTETHYPMIRLPIVSDGSLIRLTVRNTSTEAQWFVCTVLRERRRSMVEA